MSSFFNKVFGGSEEGDTRPQSNQPKPNADKERQLFDSELNTSREWVSPLSPASDQEAHSRGFVRPEKLPVRGFTAGELASLLPPEFINQQSMPAGQEVDLDLTRARQSMASGRPVVMLSDIYEACPRLFARPITSDQDFEVRLPKKRVEALLGMTGGGQAGGPSSPFQMSSDSSQQEPVARPAASEQSQPASPFEIVEPGTPQSASTQQSSVPLFSQPAPAPVSQPAPKEMLPNDHTSSFLSIPATQQHTSGEMVKVQLGKALRFVGVEVLGFSARNVPEFVISEIPYSAIEPRNPNGSATVPLSVLVSGLEADNRSGFNQADMFAHITIPADALPSASKWEAESKCETAPFSPNDTEPSSTPSASVESPFAAFARADEAKRGAAVRQSSSTEKSFDTKQEQPSSDSVAKPATRGVLEDTRALQDLSKRLGAFHEQTSKETTKGSNSPVTPGPAEPVKPLAPLSGLTAEPAANPQPKFRDLQEETRLPEGSDESFIQPTTQPTPEPAAAPQTSGQVANTELDEDEDWKQVELKAVFGLEKTLSLKGVFDLIMQLDDVRSAAFVLGQETKFSTDGFGGSAPMLGGLIESVRQLSNEIGIQGAQSFALQTSRGAVAFFSEGIGTIAVMAKSEDVSRASKQRIIVILRELVRGF